MKRLTEFASQVLLCHADDAEALPNWFVSARRSARFADVFAFDATEAPHDVERLQREKRGFDLSRYLDRFYVCVRPHDTHRRQRILDILFDCAAPEYEQLINPNQNRENIFQLLAALEAACGPLAGKLVIDFGCGVGLSKQAAQEFGVRLVGFDRCPRMRKQANAHGLEVWGPRHLAVAPKNSIDAAFCSYLFHLLPDLGSLRLLWLRLRVGGALAANFHKGRGLDRVADAFGATASEHNIEGPQLMFAHGLYRLFIRSQ